MESYNYLKKGIGRMFFCYVYKFFFMCVENYVLFVCFVYVVGVYYDVSIVRFLEFFLLKVCN